MKLLSIGPGNEAFSKGRAITGSARNINRASKANAEPVAYQENSGSAELLKMTLRGVTYIMDDGSEVSGMDRDADPPKTIELKGDGLAQLLELPVAVGTIKTVKLDFDPYAIIKGKIENKNYNDGTNTYTGINLQTKSQYYFDISSGKMKDIHGTFDDRSDDTDVALPPDYTFYSYTGTPNPEEAWLCMTNEDYFHVEMPLNQTIAEGLNPSITIVADLNRMLRFSVRGSEFVPAEDALSRYYHMFVSNHLMNYLFGAFVGEAGSLEGYEYAYAPSESEFDQAWAKRGWLTLAFDANGNFGYGALIPDSMGSGFPEGYVTYFNPTAGTFTARKDATESHDISNFTRQLTLDSSLTADIETNSEWASTFTGTKIRFVLKSRHSAAP